MTTPTKEEFLKDVENHQMRILKEDGVYRHLSFNNGKTSEDWFEIITTPRLLVINGDHGANVFRHYATIEMLDKFRLGSVSIDPAYFDKYVVSDQEEYSNGLAEDYVYEHINGLNLEYYEKEKLRDELYNNICFSACRCELLNDLESFHSFEFDFSFDRDFLERFNENSFGRYNTHYVWNLNSIVWGIQQYDKLKEQA